MRVLLVGAGGVGSAAVGIAARRDFFETLVVADYDLRRAQRAIASHPGDARLVAAQVDASSADAVSALCREHRITHVFNAVDPRFVMPVFDGAYAAGADYLDMAMSLSHLHPQVPHEQTGVKLGDGVAAFGKVVPAGGDGANRWYRVTLKEGRNREVRRLMESTGKQVSRLMRLRYGPVVLSEELKPGEWRELEPQAVAALVAQLSQPRPAR